MKNACMHDVHITGPLPPTHHNHKGWRSAPDAILPRPWVAHTNRPKGRSAARTRQSKTQVFRQTSWKYLSLIVDERVINLQRTKVYVWSDSVLCLGKILEKPQSIDAWEQRLGWLKSSQNYRNFDRIDGEPMGFEWNIFPGFNTLQLSQEVQELLLRLHEPPENLTGRIIFMSMFNDISW